MRVLQHGLTLERSASTSRRVCLLEKTQPPHRGRSPPHKLTGYECRRWCYGEHIYLVSIVFSALRCSSSYSPNAVEWEFCELRLEEVLSRLWDSQAILSLLSGSPTTR